MWWDLNTISIRLWWAPHSNDFPSPMPLEMPAYRQLTYVRVTRPLNLNGVSENLFHFFGRGFGCFLSDSFKRFLSNKNIFRVIQRHDCKCKTAKHPVAIGDTCSFLIEGIRVKSMWNPFDRNWLLGQQSWRNARDNVIKMGSSWSQPRRARPTTFSFVGNKAPDDPMIGCTVHLALVHSSVLIDACCFSRIRRS